MTKKAWKYFQNCSLCEIFAYPEAIFPRWVLKFLNSLQKVQKINFQKRKIRTLSRFFDESSFQFGESLGVDFTGEGFHFRYSLAFCFIVLFLNKLSGEFADRQLLEAVLHGGFWTSSRSKKGISSKKAKQKGNDFSARARFSATGARARERDLSRGADWPIRRAQNEPIGRNPSPIKEKNLQSQATLTRVLTINSRARTNRLRAKWEHALIGRALDARVRALRHALIKSARLRFWEFNPCGESDQLVVHLDSAQNGWAERS